MLVLPLLTLPFITMAFWALGGGKSFQSSNQTNSESGLNLELPDASMKEEKEFGKLSFYDKAEEDSIQRHLEMQSDPFYKPGLDSTLNALNSSEKPYEGRLNTSLSQVPDNAEANEAKIYERIDALNKVIQQPPQLNRNTTATITLSNKSAENFSNDVDRLEEMMQGVATNSDDPEMQQIGAVLDKILDVQHPERIKEKLKEKSSRNKDKIFAVTKHIEMGSVGLIDTAKDAVIASTEFYGIGPDELSQEQNAIEAVVHGEQSLVNGAIVKLRLLSDIYVAGTLIPRQSFVFGLATLDRERLQIEINSVRIANSLFPVKLSVYDLDGLKGIYVPGTITSDVVKQSADNSLQLMNIGALDPSLKAQAAAAGFAATKNLLNKKVKQVKVSLRAGYKVLLKDEKSLN